MQVGGFDPDYIHSCEDVDLCLRLRATGGRLRYVARSWVKHHLGQSAKQEYSRTFLWMMQSRDLYFRRWQGRAACWAFRLMLLTFVVPRLGLRLLVEGARSHGRSRAYREQARLAKGLIALAHFGRRAGVPER